MRHSILFTLVAAVVWATPGAAADPSSLGCVGVTVGRATMRSLGEKALLRQEGRPAASPDVEIDAFARAADACARQYGWSAEAAMSAASWTMTSARLDVIAEALQRDGIPPMQAGAVVGQLTPAEQEGMTREPVSAFALAALKRRAVAARIPTEGLVAGHFVLFTVLLLQEGKERARFATLVSPWR
ncbi:MAG: hypothetical protein QOH86_348 [Sphingomonadales bacterium]|nr:hypothetical protein [Sphingomonadales bacterium]